MSHSTESKCPMSCRKGKYEENCSNQVSQSIAIITLMDKIIRIL